MDERWVLIDGFPDYEVSNHGRVRRTTSRTCAKAGTILKMPLRSGYPCVDLCNQDGKRTHHVHRLVALAFIPPVAGCDEVNHIDGLKTNNHNTNLEWVDRQGNALHAYRIGLQDASGEKNGFAKLATFDVARIKRILLNRTVSYAAIGEVFGVTGDTIRAIADGRSWRDVQPAAEE